MMYKWPLMTHIYVMSTKLMFLSRFLSVFFNGTIFLKKFFSMICTLKGKNWCTIDLDDSYIRFVNKFDVL